MSEDQWNPEAVKDPTTRTELATVVAGFMEEDQTTPVGGDRSKWQSDVRLRETESVVVQGWKLYSEFSDLCDQAREMTEEPHARALLLLGIINGERRQDSPDEGLVQALFQQATVEIEELPTGDRRNRLDSLLDYHAGIWAGKVGDYFLAAKTGEKSAAKAAAAGDVKGALISGFQAAVDRVRAELIIGNSFETNERLMKLVDAERKLDTVLDGDQSPDAIRWRLLNGPSHVVICHYLADKKLPIQVLIRYLNRLTQCTELAPELAEEHRAIIVLCYACQMLNPDGQALYEKTTPEHQAISLLAIARSAVAQHDYHMAVQVYEGLLQHYSNEPSTVPIRAIAERELGSLPL